MFTQLATSFLPRADRQTSVAEFLQLVAFKQEHPRLQLEVKGNLEILETLIPYYRQKERLEGL